MNTVRHGSRKVPVMPTMNIERLELSSPSPEHAGSDPDIGAIEAGPIEVIDDMSVTAASRSTLFASDRGTAAELPLTRIEPAAGWQPVNLGEMWRFRELLFFLTWRDVKVRYKQTALG